MEYQTIFTQIEEAQTKEALFTSLAILLEKKIKDQEDDTKLLSQDEIAPVARLMAKIKTEI